MNFGYVEGLCVQLEEFETSTVVRVTVYLETNMGIEIIREIETEAEPRDDGGVDLYWEADQWTQDTIVHQLLPIGWELLGAVDPPARDPAEIPRSPRYALRTTFWVPPPGWNDDSETS
ncbi:MAG TPA: hypothetical protein VHG52_07075 [Thermomicrobiales bacterium]|nr:hypothetical protein [Thermomicrobiales bacterium]